MHLIFYLFERLEKLLFAHSVGVYGSVEQEFWNRVYFSTSFA